MTSSSDSPAAGTGAAAATAGTARPTPLDEARAERIERSDQLAEVRFLTVAEVATVMRVSKMTVYRIVHAGELPAVRVGRSFRVPERAVHDYLQAAFIEAG